MEKRFLSATCRGLELRYAPDAGEMGDDVKVDISAATGVRGYAAKFNVQSQMLVDPEKCSGPFMEVIVPGAFDGVLDQDVVCLFNHDPSMPLARTSAGTLKLTVDDVGLAYEFDLADDDVSENVAAFINDGRVNSSSFSFVCAEGGDRWERQPNGVYLRSISRLARLIDVSPVTYPAYLDASVALRSEALAAAVARDEMVARQEARRLGEARARELELLSLGRR